MLTRFSQEPTRSAPDPNHRLGLQHALSGVAAELLQTLEASECYLYWLDKNQAFTPLLAEGCPEAARELFFSTDLTPATDTLLHRMVARPMILTFSQEPGARQMHGSILAGLKVQVALATPVLSSQQLVGLLLVARREVSTEFSPLEIRQSEWLAATLAPAVENVRLYQQTLERLAEAEALHQVSLAILQKSSLEDALKIISNEAKQMTAACGASLALVENSNWIRVMVLAGETPDKLGRLRASRSHLGRAIHHQVEPLLIHQSPERADGLSKLVIPLLVKGSTLGLLTLFKKTDFSAEDARLMRIFAGQAAIAIDHAQLTSFSQEMAILEERHRLSRELHDSVNQLLYGISLYTEAALRQMDQGNLEAARRYLKNIEESDRAALKEMRMLIFGLRPSGLSQMGLQASLAQRLKSVEEKLGLQPSFKWRVTSPLEAHVEEALYGIAQEALNNVIRHAHAHTISIRLAENEQRLTLTIKDDGQGFDPEQTAGGLGLKTMRERAASLNARLKIDSQPTQGTRITVEVAL